MRQLKTKPFLNGMNNGNVLSFPVKNECDPGSLFRNRSAYPSGKGNPNEKRFLKNIRSSNSVLRFVKSGLQKILSVYYDMYWGNFGFSGFFPIFFRKEAEQ